MYCKNCGKELNENADVCLNCGTLVNKGSMQAVNSDDLTKKGWFLAILCFFLGFLGVHRFVVGKIGTGVLWLLTAGCFGIGALVDFIMILCSSFTDKDGHRISFM